MGALDKQKWRVRDEKDNLTTPRTTMEFQQEGKESPLNKCIKNSTLKGWVSWRRSEWKWKVFHKSFWNVMVLRGLWLFKLFIFTPWILLTHLSLSHNSKSYPFRPKHIKKLTNTHKTILKSLTHQVINSFKHLNFISLVI